MRRLIDVLVLLVAAMLVLRATAMADAQALLPPSIMILSPVTTLLPNAPPGQPSPSKKV